MSGPQLTTAHHLLYGGVPEVPEATLPATIVIHKSDSRERPAWPIGRRFGFSFSLESLLVRARIAMPARLWSRLAHISVSGLSVASLGLGMTRQLGALANDRRVYHPLICIIALLAGCGTTALKPEPKLVSSVTSLPPVQVPVPVRCIKEVPPMPKVTIDPNSTVLQRYYAMRELIAAQDEYAIRANAALLACAAQPSK